MGKKKTKKEPEYPRVLYVWKADHAFGPMRLVVTGPPDEGANQGYRVAVEYESQDSMGVKTWVNMDRREESQAFIDFLATAVLYENGLTQGSPFIHPFQDK